jgi:hypothetical protein
MCTRCDPAEDIDILRKAWGSRADPLIRDREPPYNSRAIIDATRPFEWKNEFPRVAQASPELMQQIESKWSELLSRRPAPAPGIGGVGQVPDVLANTTTVTDDDFPTDMTAGEGKASY